MYVQEPLAFGVRSDVLRKVSKTLVIGNGESRIGYDLNELKDRYVLVGCNAIHRDVRVDHLICCDRRMTEEALDNPLTTETKIYTRPEWVRHPLLAVPQLPYKGDVKRDDPFHWGSGGFAVLLGALLSDNVTLLGFDLYDSNKRVNNVYKDTKNYSKSTSHPIDYSYWVYQIGKVFECYPNTQFTILNSVNWKLPLEWQKSNVKFKDLLDL